MSVTLNPLYRFETFVVGTANRLAATAAKAVAETPGTVYNPLFLYARPGLGKTHLLMAIGQAARAASHDRTVEYLTLDEFVETFHHAIAAGQADAYRRRFAAMDLVLVDDVQFLAGQREMQAELLRLTDALQAANHQMVLTSDRPPAEIEALDERLIRRFAGGLVIDMDGPDYETRVAILRRKAEERRVGFALGVIEAVAQLEIDNVRELQGALNRLVAFQAISDRPLDAAQAVALVAGAAPGGVAPDAASGSGESASASVPPAAASPAGVASPTDPTAPTNTARSAVASPAAPHAPSEFDDFLSEVSATLSSRVDGWRETVTAAIARWTAEGYGIARLQTLLDRGLTDDPAEVLRDFEIDVTRLRALEAAAVALAPELEGANAFRDPDDLTAAEALLDRTRDAANPLSAPSPEWRLADWRETATNRLALGAAEAVAAEPATRYNPLVIAGPKGAGKTHLLHGVGNALAGRLEAPVACLGASEFTAELIEAIDKGSVAAWRARYRRAGALLLDDVHLIAGKERTQDELFVLFNLFLESGRQMVFTSAVPLADVAGLEPRLRTRLEGGLVVELPAFEPASASPRRNGASPAGRGSGVVPATLAGMRSREKMVWEWPEPTDRLIEEPD